MNCREGRSPPRRGGGRPVLAIHSHLPRSRVTVYPGLAPGATFLRRSAAKTQRRYSKKWTLSLLTRRTFDTDLALLLLTNDFQRRLWPRSPHFTSKIRGIAH